MTIRPADFLAFLSGLLLLLFSFGCATQMQSLKAEKPTPDDYAVLQEIKVSDDASQISVTADRRLVYAYYKEQNPCKLIIDMAQTDPGVFTKPILVEKGSVGRIEVLKHQSGTSVITRMEISLTRDDDASVVVPEKDRNSISISFKAPSNSDTLAAAQAGGEKGSIHVEDLKIPQPVSPEPADAKTPVVSESIRTALVTPAGDDQSAPVLTNIAVQGDNIELKISGAAPRFQSFRLTGPKRLVLDLFETKGGMTATSVPINLPGFANARIGKSPEKIRIVFDITGKDLPPYQVLKGEHGLTIQLKDPLKQANLQEVTSPADRTTPASGEATPISTVVSSTKTAPVSENEASPAVPQRHEENEDKAAGLRAIEKQQLTVAASEPPLVPASSRTDVAPGQEGSNQSKDMEAPTPENPSQEQTGSNATRDRSGSEGASILSIDFHNAADTAQIAVKFATTCTVEKPVKVAAGYVLPIKNCRLPKNLQRSIDTSAFPSSVKGITPYQVKTGDDFDAKILVKLRDDAHYSLKKDSGSVTWDFKNKEGLAGPTPLPNVQPAPQLVSGNAVPAVQEVDRTSVAKAEPVNSAVEELVPHKKVKPEVSSLDPKSAKTGADLADPTVQEKKPLPLNVSQAKTVFPFDKPLNAEDLSRKKHLYTGRRVTLEFSDAEVRKIFQLIAEVSNLNFLIADDVTGTISLKLVNVPWDQALDVILETKGLEKRQEGNVLYIKPKGKFRTAEQEEAAIREEREKRMELTTRLFDVNFAAVGEIASQFEKMKSPRGAVSQDSRTNRVIVTDNKDRLDRMENLLKQLDVAEKQVMIEARIVEATSTFTRDLGVQWGLHYRDGTGSIMGIKQLDTGFGGDVGEMVAPVSGTMGPGAAVGMSFGKLGSNVQLDMRLSAAATAGLIKIISTPKVVTLNNKTARISQGQSIPYQSVSAEGTKTEFVQATLSLDVTPHVTADGNVGLKVKATNNSAGTGNPPSINMKEATTELQVMNGETTVIGGIYVDSDTESNTGVPFLMDIPLLGWLFKSNAKQKTKTELLIFITPRIVG